MRDGHVNNCSTARLGVCTARLGVYAASCVGGKKGNKGSKINPVGHQVLLTSLPNHLLSPYTRLFILASSLCSALVFCLHFYYSLLSRPGLPAPVPPPPTPSSQIYLKKKKISKPDLFPWVHQAEHITPLLHSSVWPSLFLSFSYFACWIPLHAHISHPLCSKWLDESSPMTGHSKCWEWMNVSELSHLNSSKNREIIIAVQGQFVSFPDHLIQKTEETLLSSFVWGLSTFPQVST